jgi:hypothetical protein
VYAGEDEGGELDETAPRFVQRVFVRTDKAVACAPP